MATPVRTARSGIRPTEREADHRDVVLTARYGLKPLIHPARVTPPGACCRDVDHGMAEQEGYIEIIQALGDVPGQAVGPGQDLRHCLHLGPFQGQPPGHDQPDVPGAQDDCPPARQIALDIDQALGRPRGVHPRRPGAGDVDGAPGPLPAAHGQDNGLGPDLVNPFDVDGPDQTGLHLHDHCVGHDLNALLLQSIDEALGIFHPGQFLAEEVQAEAVVNALLEDAPQEFVPLDDEDVTNAAWASRAAPTPAGPLPL